MVVLSIQFLLKLASLRFCRFVDLLGLLCLILDLSFGGLHHIVLNDIAGLDDIGNSSIVQNILAFLNDFLEEGSCQVDFGMLLFRNKKYNTIVSMEYRINELACDL